MAKASRRSVTDGSARLKAKANKPLHDVERVEPEVQEVPERELPEGSGSPLGIYLSMSGVSLTAAAKAFGIPYRTVEGWMKGKTVPSLAAAYEIERLTKGVVPMEAWLALPAAKSIIAAWRAQQPERLRHAPGGITPGGFARPFESKSKQQRQQKDAVAKALKAQERRFKDEDPGDTGDENPEG